VKARGGSRAPSDARDEAVAARESSPVADAPAPAPEIPRKPATRLPRRRVERPGPTDAKKSAHRSALKE
jgi:hypothetical protein